MKLSLSDSFSLRPCEDRDRDFLISLYCASRESEAVFFGEALLRMQYEARERDYAQRFAPTRRQIVDISRVSAGSLWVANLADEVRLVDIALLPEHQNHGIGSQILRDVLDQAKKQAKPVVLTAGLTNKRAIRLYERLGFRVVSTTDMDLLMQYDPEG